MEKRKGRPLKKKTEKLCEFANIRFSKKELDNIDKKANQLNITRSEFLRCCAIDNLEKSPAFLAIPKPIKAELNEFRKQVRLLKIAQIKLREEKIEINIIEEIIIGLHRIIATIEKIVKSEVVNQHILPLKNIVYKLNLWMKSENISSSELLEISRNLSDILNQKEHYFIE